MQLPESCLRKRACPSPVPPFRCLQGKWGSWSLGDIWSMRESGNRKRAWPSDETEGAWAPTPRCLDCERETSFYIAAETTANQHRTWTKKSYKVVCFTVQARATCELALSTQTSWFSGEKRLCRKTHAERQGAVGPVRNGDSGLHV